MNWDKHWGTVPGIGWEITPKSTTIFTVILLLLILVIVLIVVYARKARPKPDGNALQAVALTKIPNSIIVREESVSVRDKIDLLDSSQHQIGYYWHPATTSLTTNEYQYVDNSASDVSLVNAIEKTSLGNLTSWNFTSQIDFTPCPNTLNLATYSLTADVQQQFYNSLWLHVYTQYSISKNGQPFASSTKVDIVNSDVTITQNGTNVVLATLHKPILDTSSISSFINMSYYIDVQRPDLIDSWFVGFLGSIILIHLREARRTQK